MSRTLDDFSDLTAVSTKGNSYGSSGSNLDDFSDVVPGGFNATGSSATGTVDQYGMPSNNPMSQNPTNLIQTPPDNSSNGGFITSLEAYAGNAVGTIKAGATSLMSGVESLSSTILHDADGAIKYAYSGVKTVASDVTGGVTGIGNGLFRNMVIWAVVVGGLIYLISSTNNFKINAKV